MTQPRSEPGVPGATQARFPRELVRASAGTGKTFRISSRIIGLLATGAEPEQILASTFTRKAAGEILDRVLFRLAEAALDEEKARELSRHAVLSGADPPHRLLGPDDALELLRLLVRRLHRVDVATLDALFVRMARTFGLELGLPPGWTIADEPTWDRLRSEAIQDVLDRGDPGSLARLLRETARGHATRRVHVRLADVMDELHRLYRQVAPAAHRPWSPFRSSSGPEDPEADRRELARRIAAVEPPLNKSGSQNKPWTDALERTADALRHGEWDELWSRGPGKKFLQGEETYHGRPFPPGLDALLEEARQLTAAVQAPKLDAEARALGRLAASFDRALADRQLQAGAYRFSDVTHHLRAAADPVAGRSDLHHRLDRRTRHVLLDEFQDTSPGQWDALRPLVDRLAESTGAGGATVVVADPKQSIYEWRDADPTLVDRVGEAYDLEEDRLHVSWRSAPEVLEFVNSLFGELSANPVVEELEHGPEVVREWAASFDEHEPAPPRADDPGHVRVEVGPRDEGRGSDRPRLLARAAELVAELRDSAPGATIGVLTRRNETVARLIHGLHDRGIEASEEGGTPVDDAAPVAAILALLRLADHPGDRISRYHVAATPLGEVLGYTDHQDDQGARRLARRVRRSLLRDGYGPTVAGWTRALTDRVSPRELRRMEQLIELGFRWEDRAGLRPGEFARLAESTRMVDPRVAPVRVMTAHQAKGLEFDVVILPELEHSLAGGGRPPAVLPERDPGTGAVQRVFPYVKKDLRPLFPEILEATRQAASSRLRDELSWLYVATTRAKHALHLLLAADRETGPGGGKTHARLVRAALGAGSETVADGDVLYERGPRTWHRHLDGNGSSRAPGDGGPAAAEPLPLRVDPGRPRTRILLQRSASDLEAGEEIAPREILRLDVAGAYRRGDVVHRWCQEIRWIEDGLPPDDTLLRQARRVAPEMTPQSIRRLAAEFRQWLEHPQVRGALSREAARSRVRHLAERGAAEEPSLVVHTERPFAHRQGDELLTGVIDRLVLVMDRGREPRGRPPVLEAQVLDFKTDDLEAVDERSLRERTERYAPQLRAYRRGVAAAYGLELENIRGRLVYLRPGVVTEP